MDLNTTEIKIEIKEEEQWFEPETSSNHANNTFGQTKENFKPETYFDINENIIEDVHEPERSNNGVSYSNQPPTTMAQIPRLPIDQNTNSQPTAIKLNNHLETSTNNVQPNQQYQYIISLPPNFLNFSTNTLQPPTDKLTEHNNPVQLINTSKCQPFETNIISSNNLPIPKLFNNRTRAIERSVFRPILPCPVQSVKSGDDQYKVAVPIKPVTKPVNENNTQIQYQACLEEAFPVFIADKSLIGKMLGSVSKDDEESNEKKRIEAEKEEEKRQKQEESRKLFKCDLCEKSVKGRYRFEAHKKKHEQIYQCEECGKILHHKRSLNAHLRWHQGLNKRFECSVCKRMFSQRKYLKEHIASHGESEPFNCEKCGQSCKTKKKLKIHQYSHMENHPFKCDVCEKCFTTGASLRRHKITHGSDHPYKCDVCNKGFYRTDHLKLHQETHQPVVKFDQCDKTFTMKQSLENHMKLHLDIRPFKCKECGKSYTRKKYLTAHVKTHSGGNSNKCVFCNKSYTTSFYLKIHMDSHNEISKPYKCDTCSEHF